MVGNTPVTTFKELSFNIRNHLDESLDPSGHIQLTHTHVNNLKMLVK